MPQPSSEFGEELRKRRLDAGLSLTALSAVVHYSKAQLSKVERGIKRPAVIWFGCATPPSTPAER